MMELTPEELKAYNGQGGKPVYIAYKGDVYDVTGSTLWEGGSHFEHVAGHDLTAELADAPHMEEVFERYPLVGKLKV